MAKVPYNFKDLTGHKFGRLTVIKRVDDKRQGTFWLCQCDCGGTKIAETRNLCRGLTQSCGCLHKEEMSKRELIDLTGRKFGRLTVLGRAENHGKDTFWKCQCECGNIKEVNGAKLKNGHTKSCGCLRTKRKIKSNIQRNYHKTHGMSETRLYRIYKKMYRRCYKPQTKYYENYGGRGITICPEWLGEHGFENFSKWALSHGYADNLSIDRIDNDKGYSPDNCKWSTAKEQANNTRSTVFLTYKGETKPASEWSEITGIRQDTLTMRKRNGWTDEECIETPLRGRMGKRKSNSKQMR